MASTRGLPAAVAGGVGQVEGGARRDRRPGVGRQRERDPVDEVARAERADLRLVHPDRSRPSARCARRPAAPTRRRPRRACAPTGAGRSGASIEDTRPHPDYHRRTPCERSYDRSMTTGVPALRVAGGHRQRRLGEDHAAVARGLAHPPRAAAAGAVDRHQRVAAHEGAQRRGVGGEGEGERAVDAPPLGQRRHRVLDREAPDGRRGARAADAGRPRRQPPRAPPDLQAARAQVHLEADAGGAQAQVVGAHPAVRGVRAHRAAARAPSAARGRRCAGRSPSAAARCRVQVVAPTQAHLRRRPGAGRAERGGGDHDPRGHRGRRALVGAARPSAAGASARPAAATTQKLENLHMH